MANNNKINIEVGFSASKNDLDELVADFKRKIERGTAAIEDYKRIQSEKFKYHAEQADKLHDELVSRHLLGRKSRGMSSADRELKMLLQGFKEKHSAAAKSAAYHMADPGRMQAGFDRENFRAMRQKMSKGDMERAEIVRKDKAAEKAFIAEEKEKAKERYAEEKKGEKEFQRDRTNDQRMRELNADGQRAEELKKIKATHADNKKAYADLQAEAIKYNKAMDASRKLNEDGTRKAQRNKRAEEKKALAQAHREALAEDKQFEKMRRMNADGQRAADLKKIKADERAKSKQLRRANRDDLRGMMQDAVMFNSLVGAVFGSMPGGGIVQAGAYGLSSGFRRGATKIDPKTGELVEREGSDKWSNGIATGLAGGAAAAGLAALAAAFTNGLMGSKRTQAEIFSLAQASGGSLEMGRAGRAAIGREHTGMTMADATPFAAQALKSTRGLGGVGAVLRSQVMAGAGGDMAGLLGAMTQGNAFVGSTGQSVDEVSKKALKDIFAAGIVQGFKNGNIAEMIAGATSIVNQRILGTTTSRSAGSNIAAAAALMGGSNAFKGAAGFQMMQGLESMITGQGGAMSQALSLMSGGLGSGSSYVQARINAQRGGIANRGPAAIGDFMSQFNSAVGGAGATDERIMAFKMMSGLSESAASEFLGMDPSQWGSDRAKGLLDSGKDYEKEAFRAMSQFGNWRSIAAKIENMGNTIGMMFEKFGLIEAMTKALKHIDETLTEIATVGGLLSEGKHGAAAKRAATWAADGKDPTSLEGAGNIAKNYARLLVPSSGLSLHIIDSAGRRLASTDRREARNGSPTQVKAD